METFEFWAREWPIITQAPHIAVAGLFVVLVAAWSIAKWHYSGELASLKALNAVVQERVALALDNERVVKEKLIDAQNLVEELNDQIEANEEQAVLLRSSNNTVAAFDQLVSATNQLGATLATTRSPTEQSSANPLIPLRWREEAPGIWKASSTSPDVGFRIEMESSDCFALLGAKTCIGKFASLDDAQQGAEQYRYKMLIEEGMAK
jgi:hypothetical protein